MPTEINAARQNMVESQVRPSDVTNPAIVAAMREIPRETVCGGKSHLAYADTEVEYAPGRWLLRPRDVSKLLQAVAPRAGETALAISAPYAALVLQEMGLKVETADAADNLSGQFDVVICEGALSACPEGWTDLLKTGGRLGLVERTGQVGHARVYLRTDDGVGSRIHFDSSAPLLGGFERAPHFAF